MHDLEANADSVYHLVTKLCGSVLRQEDALLDEAAADAAVRKLRSQSFEILLKKSPRPHFYSNTAEDEIFEPQRELDVQVFAAKLNANADPQVCNKFADFEEKQRDEIISEQYFTAGPGRAILQLLLALQGNVPESGGMPANYTPPLLVPGPFTLHANYQNNRYYPTHTVENFNQPSPRYFKGLQPIQNQENPYLPKFLFDGEVNKLAEINKKYAITPEADTHQKQLEEPQCTFTGMTKRYFGSAMRMNARAFRLFTDNDEFKEKPKFVPRKCLPIKPIAAPATTPQERYAFAWNWESLGCFGIRCAKPFSCESNVTLNLQSFNNQTLGGRFEARVMKQQQFLKDLKSLTVGIQSDTFQHDEYIVFSMQPDITIEGLLPSTISNYVTDFLECGTCYKRMQTMIMKRDYKLMFEGFMFKALCSAVDEFLLTFRQLVFAHDDQHLMSFYKRMKKMMKQITNLSYTLAIHPNVDASVKPPMGSQFLGYLYREIVRLTEKDYITLLVFILKRCCHVYFKHLQKWIYYGLLDDPSNELFICFVDHYRQNTKYFYDKAYFVRKESVPGFFQNYEDQILQCGKYTMLLKAYKPNHPLFDLEYPAITACLSFDDIRQLETSCARYRERAIELCGKPCATIRDMFETRAEQKRNFYQMANQRSRANIEKWTEEQQARALLAAEQKKKRHDELTLQLQDAKQRKINERRASVELELKSLREAELLEDQRLLRENINLRKRIEYYQELNDELQSVGDHGKPKPKGNLPLPLSGRSGKTAPPQTPCSTISDFESCCGEDEDPDTGSDYVECISDDFVQKFEQSERELFELCAKDIEESEFKEVDTEQQHTLTVKEVSSDVTLLTPTRPTIKRSTSDLINSNELPPLIMSVLEKNRFKNMSGTNMQQSVDLSKTVAGDLQVIAALVKPPLTAAQLNKMKVLAHEFGTYSHTKSMPDINLNTLPDSELTDLQRNRKRMMQNDTFSEYNKDPLSNRAKLNLDLDTDRSRNRRKVLESEYNILTGQTLSTTTLTGELLTPMSTTSDTPITETSNELVNAKQSDLANGNVSAKPPLKLNVELANGQQQSKEEQQPEVVKEASTALPLTTPECALNTAGLNAKQGFNFVNKEKLKKEQLEQIAEVPIRNDSLLEEDACPTQDYNQPYQRCIELISSNFKCPARSPYFRLNLTSPKPAKASSSTKLSGSKDAQSSLNSMSVITLTEFLQKSVIIPMSTHLELVNNEVMRLFLEDLRVLSHLRSLRHYFFLMDGEFGAIICDGIIGKLEDGASPAKLLNYQMLHSILDAALGSSIMGNDKNAENLSFIVNDVPEKFDLNSPSVLDNLSLSYRINWPLNLILNPETLEQYANIFKYLIKVRRISWVLERAYQLLKEAVKKHGKNLLRSPQYRHVQQIRHKFYHFVHALQNHITANALQASWKTFKDELLACKSIEDIYRKHTTYVKRIIFLCMLNRRSVEFYNTIENIFKITLRFFNNLKLREFKVRSGDEHFTHSRYEKLSNDELEFDKFLKYTIYLGNKIVRHGYQEEIGEFISLINFNQYYSVN